MDFCVEKFFDLHSFNYICSCKFLSWKEMVLLLHAFQYHFISLFNSCYCFWMGKAKLKKRT